MWSKPSLSPNPNSTLRGEVPCWSSHPQCGSAARGEELRRKTSRALRNLLENCRVWPLAEPPAWIKQPLCPTWCRMPHPRGTKEKVLWYNWDAETPREETNRKHRGTRTRKRKRARGPRPGLSSHSPPLLRCPSSSSSLLLLFSHFLFTFPHLTFSLVSSFLSLSTRRPGCDSGQPSPLNSVGGIPCSRVHTPSPGLSFPQTTRRCL